MNTVNPVLAKKLGLPTAADAGEPAVGDEPSSPMRQMRRAMARALDTSVGLSSSVLGIAEDVTDAETLIEEAPEGWIVLGLRNGSTAGLTGLMLLDANLRSALVEMQTMGRLLPKSEEPRPITRIDGIMSVPFASTLLGELEQVGFAGGRVSLGGYDLGPMDDLRTAGLVMVQGTYLTWRITLQMGGSEAQGEMILALKSMAETDAEGVDLNADWQDALRAAVCDAPAELEAVLARQRIPIEAIEAFEVGQLIPLPGTTVGSVKLMGAGGEELAQARLGQVAGKRAVRLEATPIQMQDDVPRMAPSSAQAAIVGDGSSGGQPAASASS